MLLHRLMWLGKEHYCLFSVVAYQASQMISKNAASTLRNFCRWQHDVNIDDDTDAHHHDTALLITR